MILGIGTDIIDIRRIEKAIEKFSLHFINRIFTISEQEYANKHKHFSSSYAKRFAAKEAFFKAIIRQNAFVPISWKDIEVINDKKGYPFIQPSISLAHKLQELFKKEIKIDLSLSDEYPYAQAFVIISRISF